jgi:hypothetical protein
MTSRHDEGPITAPIPVEFTTYMQATHGMDRFARGRADAATFPDLAVAPPLILTVDVGGWYQLTVVDPETSERLTNFVRYDWARDQQLARLGVTLSRIALRSRGVRGRIGLNWITRATLCR